MLCKVSIFFLILAVKGDLNINNRDSPGDDAIEEQDAWKKFYESAIASEQKNGEPLSRHRRASNDSDLSVWEEIEEFYSDQNNLAMYCVLPIMVLLYGGCASIYCVYKCRQYCKRKKHKRLKEDDMVSLTSSKNDLNQDESNDKKERPISQISQAWHDMNSGPDNTAWSGQTEAQEDNSPLPWAVQEQNQAPDFDQKAREQSSRASYLDDKLQNEDIALEEGRGSRVSEARRIEVQTSSLDDTLHEEAASTFGATAVASEKYNFEEDERKAQFRKVFVKPQGEDSRAEANLNDYATNRSSAAKASDYSRFADSRPIEIVPLSANPNLVVWDPLHKRPWGNSGETRPPPRIEPIGEACNKGRDSVQAMKEEMLARYDALSTYQMAKKAAEILQTNAVEKSPFQRKPTKKKNIFIAE